MQTGWCDRMRTRPQKDWARQISESTHLLTNTNYTDPQHARTHSHTKIQVCVCQIPAEHGMFEQGSLLKCVIRLVFEQKETATYQRTAGISQSLQWLIC